MRCAANELTARVAHSCYRPKSFWFDLTDKHSVAKTLAIWAKQRLAAQCALYATPRHDLRPSTAPKDCSEPTPSKTLCETARQTSCSLLAQGRRRPIPRRA